MGDLGTAVLEILIDRNSQARIFPANMEDIHSGNTDDSKRPTWGQYTAGMHDLALNSAPEVFGRHLGGAPKYFSLQGRHLGPRTPRKKGVIWGKSLGVVKPL
jgi:hypothetical protein